MRRSLLAVALIAIVPIATHVESASAASVNKALVLRTEGKATATDMNFETFARQDFTLLNED